MRTNAPLKYGVIALGVIAIDQTTKYLAYTSGFGSFLDRMQPVFSKVLLPNYNFAFSIPLPHIFAYVFYTFILIAFCIWYFSGTKNAAERVGFYLVIGGAISNIIDRMILGYVRDFIAGFWGNIFNIADIAIISGIILILIANVRKSKPVPPQK